MVFCNGHGSRFVDRRDAGKEPLARAQSLGYLSSMRERTSAMGGRRLEPTIFEFTAEHERDDDGRRGVQALVIQFLFNQRGRSRRPR